MKAPGNRGFFIAGGGMGARCSAVFFLRRNGGRRLYFDLSELAEAPLFLLPFTQERWMTGRSTHFTKIEDQ